MRRTSLAFRVITAAIVAAASVLTLGALTATSATAAPGDVHPGLYVSDVSDAALTERGWVGEVQVTHNGEPTGSIELGRDADSEIYRVNSIGPDGSTVPLIDTATFEDAPDTETDASSDAGESLTVSRLLGVEKTLFEETRGTETGVEWGEGYAYFLQFAYLNSFRPSSFPFFGSTVTALPPFTEGQPYSFSYELPDVAVDAEGTFLEPKPKYRHDDDPFPDSTTTYTYDADGTGLVTAASITTIADAPDATGNRAETRLDFTFVYGPNDPARPDATTILPAGDYDNLQATGYSQQLRDQLAATFSKKIEKKQGTWTTDKLDALMLKIGKKLGIGTLQAPGISGLRFKDPWRGPDLRLAWQIKNGTATRIV